MVITRTPFRITLGGGGTDLPSYYTKYGGFIFAVGIDKYLSITVNRPVIDQSIRVKYANSEAVENLDDLRHDLAREILRNTGIVNNIDINSVGDLPAGSGLGSSSCYAIGLLHAIHAMKRDHVSLAELAEEDFHLEAEVLTRPIGKQDPYLAAFGGLTVLDIEKNGKVAVRAAKVPLETADELNKNLLVFYTGVTRSADEILNEQSKGVREERKEVVDNMHYIKELGYKILEAVERGNLDELGKGFHDHWQHKKKISTKMSNPDFDRIYDAALRNKALGGKISGAGGGGFFTFYVPEGHRQFREAMRALGLREIRYRFDFDGSKVLADFS